MVRRAEYQVISFCLLTLLLTHNPANAQYSNGPVAFIPFGSPTLWEGGSRSDSAAAPGYAGSTTPILVARQGRPPCGACPETLWSDGGHCYTQPQPNFDGQGPMVAQPGCDSCAADGCQACVSCQPRPAAIWYASAAGLFLGRDRPGRVWTSYENNNNPNQLMNTADADPDWEGGADFRLGRCFGCNRWALELGYWSVNNFTASTSQTHANDVSSPLQFNDLEFAVGDPVVDYFDSAAEHRLNRTNELHNVELNLIAGRSPMTGCCRWSQQLVLGVRYFKFDEDLTFASLDQGGTWGGNGGLDEVALSDSIENDLIGVQLGCLFQRQLGSRTRLLLTPKFGIYNNHIEHSFDLRRGDGTAAMPSAFSGVAGSYPVESSTDVVAFLSEASIGLQYQPCCRWTLSGGYRVVVINNVGLADEQIPQFIVDIPEIANIDTNGSLVLQGAYFGATRCF